MALLQLLTSTPSRRTGAVGRIGRYLNAQIPSSRRAVEVDGQRRQRRQPRPALVLLPSPPPARTGSKPNPAPIPVDFVDDDWPA